MESEKQKLFYPEESDKAPSGRSLTHARVLDAIRTVRVPRQLWSHDTAILPVSDLSRRPREV